MAKMSAKLPKFTFIREAFGEMKHVTWPKPRHIAVFTGLVIIVVIIFSYFINFVDTGFIAGLRELRSGLNPEGVTTTQPNIQAAPGKILDAEGNEIKVESLLTPEQLNDVENKATPAADAE